jgi:hypothetical protein
MEKKFPATFHICHKIKDGCVIHKLRANLGLCAFIDRVFFTHKKICQPGASRFRIITKYIHLFVHSKVFGFHYHIVHYLAGLVKVNILA